MVKYTSPKTLFAEMLQALMFSRGQETCPLGVEKITEYSFREEFLALSVDLTESPRGLLNTCALPTLRDAIICLRVVQN